MYFSGAPHFGTALKKIRKNGGDSAHIRVYALRTRMYVCVRCTSCSAGKVSCWSVAICKSFEKSNYQSL